MSARQKRGVDFPTKEKVPSVKKRMKWKSILFNFITNNLCSTPHQSPAVTASPQGEALLSSTYFLSQFKRWDISTPKGTKKNTQKALAFWVFDFYSVTEQVTKS